MYFSDDSFKKRGSAMSSNRNSGRGGGLTILATVVLSALIATLLVSAPAQSSASNIVQSAPAVQSVLPASALTLAEDEYVPATNPLVTPGYAARGSSTGAGIIYPGGPGHPSKVYAVKWFSDGKCGWCYRFGLHTPDSNGSRLASKIPGMTLEQSRRVWYVVNKHCDSTSNNLTAAVALVVWHFENSAAFRTWFPWAKKNGHISDAVLKLYNRLLKESEQHGPYKMNVKFKGDKAEVGEPGQAVVAVKTAHGRPAKGRKLNLSGANLRIVSKARTTDGHGKLAVRYVPTSTGRVKLGAVLTAPGIKGYLSSPSSGNQALVLHGPAYKKSASASSLLKAPAPDVEVKCEKGCEKATVTMGGHNPKRAKPLRYSMEVDGKVRAKLDLRPGAKKSLSRQLPDGSEVVIYACYLNKVGGKCVTPRDKVDRLTVFCPPWAKAELVVRVVMGCETCQSSTNSLQFWAPNKSIRYYTGRYKLDGKPMTFNYKADGEWHTVSGLDDGKVTDVGFTAYVNSDRSGKHFTRMFDCPTCG